MRGAGERERTGYRAIWPFGHMGEHFVLIALDLDSRNSYFEQIQIEHGRGVEKVGSWALLGQRTLTLVGWRIEEDKKHTIEDASPRIIN